MKNILIIEDTPNDIKYYQALIRLFPQKVSFLFFTTEQNYIKEKLKEIVELFYGNLLIKNYFVCTKENIKWLFMIWNM